MKKQQQQQLTPPQSPRALATREKNREAVRKCRQRKRERTEELKQRCDELSKENVRLRMKLELGNEDATQQKVAKGRLLIEEMARQLVGLEGHLAEKEKTPQKDSLDILYQQFFERHMELGPDKMSSLSFVVKRLHGLIEPDAMTKAYLFVLTQPEECFLNNNNETTHHPSSTTNWWKQFSDELGLTEEQKRQLKLRRLTAHRAKAELFYVAHRAHSMSKSIVDRKHLAQSFMELIKIFTHAQLAKFVIWVSTDACGNELLDMLWGELIEQIDLELSQAKAIAMESDVGAMEVQRLLNAVRQENGTLFKSLFESPDIRDAYRKAKRIFTDDAVLIDPSNGGEYRGLEQVMKYVDKMRRAFTPASLKLQNYRLTSSGSSSSTNDQQQQPKGLELKFEEKSLEFAGDKAIGKFQVQGSYHGRLLDETYRAKEERVMVECETVVAITFAESSAKIKELVVSNDLIGLFQALGNKLDSSMAAGMTNNHHHHYSNNRKKEEEEEEEISSSPKISQVLQSTTTAVDILNLNTNQVLVTELKNLFEQDDPKIAWEIATKILSDRCVFVDSNMGTDHRGVNECFSYVKRIRSAFPKLKIVQDSFVVGQDDQLRIEWLVEAAYGGKLASQQAPKPCTLKTVLFLTKEVEELRITNLAMSWNATSLLRELGVQLKDEEKTRMGTRRQSTSASSTPGGSTSN